MKHRTPLGPEVELIIRKYFTIDREGNITTWDPVAAAIEIDALYRRVPDVAPSTETGEKQP